MKVKYSSSDLLHMPATLRLVEEPKLLASLTIVFQVGSEL